MGEAPHYLPQGRHLVGLVGYLCLYPGAASLDGSDVSSQGLALNLVLQGGARGDKFGGRFWDLFQADVL